MKMEVLTFLRDVGATSPRDVTTQKTMIDMTLVEFYVYYVSNCLSTQYFPGSEQYLNVLQPSVTF
jgi:hypothetical protein